MKKLIFTVSFLILLSQLAISQTKLLEGFETSDSATLPEGWNVWNDASFYILPNWNWLVRDTGYSIPGLQSALQTSHTGIKACGVTWYAAQDTNGIASVSDAWLVTKRVDISAGDSLIFWATGGTPNYTDSLQIWVGVDSLPPDFIDKIGHIFWDTGSVYGHWNRYSYSLNAYAGQTIWIGFRYNMDASVNGFYVNLDDIFVGNPIGIQPISSNIPKVYALRQNYPNPFNPVTNIDFDLPKASHVSIVVYNELGQRIRELVDQQMQPGSYKVDFDATNLPSGVYFYRINAGAFVQTKKMVLTK